MVRIAIVGILSVVVLYLLFQIVTLSWDNVRASGGNVLFLGLVRTTVSDQDQKKVSAALKNFFKDFEDPTLSPEKQLDDFSIIKVDHFDQVRTGVAFRVFFSVKPARPTSSYWLKINGTRNPDGWITDKVATGKMIQADEQYYVISLDINSNTQISK